MNSIDPPTGSAAWPGRFLTLLALLTIVPGCIHVFLPDGGAGSIAGIDLAACRDVVVALFAWAGATQIALGIVMLVVSLRYRELVPLLLGVVLLERSLHALNAWVIKPSRVGHHPPEHFAVLVMVPLIAVAFVAAVRGGRGRSARR